MSPGWFEKPAGRTAPMYDHGNGLVCLVLSGELTVYTENEAETPVEYDSVWLDP